MTVDTGLLVSLSAEVTVLDSVKNTLFGSDAMSV